MIEFALIIFLLGMLSAWEEIQQLVQRGSWKKEDYYSFLFWDTAWDGKLKLFDSHHIAFGLFVLVMVLGFYFIRINELWHLPLIWIFIFWIRNIGMHILFKKKPIWKYLYTL